MELGLIGLGKMGGNMAERLVKKGHRVVGYDRSPETCAQAKAKGIEIATSLEELHKMLTGTRCVWMMVPAGDPTEATMNECKKFLSPGDVLIDGGNSNYKDSIRRGNDMRAAGFRYLDVGTSGGIWGITEGYAMMIGGDPEAVAYMKPLFEALAPAADRGWSRVGPSGAGHFVKMVHNGIEYGMMQAYAEGFALMNKKTEFALDLPQISEMWRHGSVVRSWLLDLLSNALKENPSMAGIAPFVPDSGEGRWTVLESIELDVPTPVITASLYERFRSRDSEAYYDKLLAAMRNQFGGHAIKKS